MKTEAKQGSELVQQATKALCKPSPPGAIVVSKNEKNGNYEISKYSPGEVSDAVLATSIKKLQVAFPSRPPEFFNLMAERIVANGFSDEKLEDAVGKAIDTFSYKEINISDVVNFDRKIRLYTYNEVANAVAEQGYSMGRDFEKREVDGRVFWVKVTDLK